MTYVVLRPHSITNPHDQYAVVDYDEWSQYVDGKLVGLPVAARTTTGKEAAQEAFKLNRGVAVSDGAS